MLSEMTTKHASNSPGTHKNITILLRKIKTRLQAVSRAFSWSVDFNARKRETARSLACNWRQAQFSALKGYMYIMGEKQTGHFLLQKLSLIISISMASHLVPLWTEACGKLEMAHWFSCLPFLTFRLSTYKFSKLISIYFLKEWV